MIYKFNSNSYLDLLIFSGVEIDLKDQVHPGLIGDAAKTAMKQVKDSYDKYKSQLNLKYSRFLNNFEFYRNELMEKETGSVRYDVANKLGELAKKRIEEKESQYSCMRRIAHIIIQFFKLHGLRTKGERGLEIAETIKTKEHQIFISDLKEFIYPDHVLQILIPMVKAFEPDVLEKEFLEIKARIDKLDDKQFEEVLDQVIFNKKEEKDSGIKNKYAFYINLCEEKKNTFEEILLSKRYWFELAYDIIEGATSKEAFSFISDKMVTRFQEDPNPTIITYSSCIDKTAKNVCFNNFFRFLTEKAIKDYLSKEDDEKVVKLFDSLQAELIITMLQYPLILSNEEVHALKSKVDLSWLKEV